MIFAILFSIYFIASFVDLLLDMQVMRLRSEIEKEENRLLEMRRSKWKIDIEIKELVKLKYPN